MDTNWIVYLILFIVGGCVGIILTSLATISSENDIDNIHRNDFDNLDFTDLESVKKAIKEVKQDILMINIFLSNLETLKEELEKDVEA